MTGAPDGGSSSLDNVSHTRATTLKSVRSCYRTA